jgi:crotonobetainyl-CoA:carnitine CoA-transferase CaiB-like acyl-CoA transferase
VLLGRTHVIDFIMHHQDDINEHSSSRLMLLPLQGLRVLDCSRVLAGPLATMMLGDLGAHVLKVERPGAGDDTRGWGPPFDAEGRAAYFLAVNRNKKSVALDLADDADRAVFRSLLAGADVVLENFRPQQWKRWRLEPREQLARHPALLWCTIAGFPDAPDRPGYDFVVQAEQGWMAITGEPDGAPMKHGVALADVLAGKDAAIAVLAALARPRAGRSVDERHLHVSLAGSAAAALVNVAQNVLVSGSEARRWGNAHANLVPYQCFDAADGALVIAVGSDAQWTACARALDLPALADDAALATNAGRVAARTRVVSALAARLREHTVAHWTVVLDAAGVPCGRIRGVADVVAEAGGDPVLGMPPAAGGTRRSPPPASGRGRGGRPGRGVEGLRRRDRFVTRIRPGRLCCEHGAVAHRAPPPAAEGLLEIAGKL